MTRSSPRAPQDLLAEQLVARVGADAVHAHVALGQRRQDADHHQVRARPAADFSSASLRLRRRLSSKRLEPALAQLGRRHVDLDVELAELGLEVGVGDRRERLGVLERRVAVLVDQVELDLEAGHRVVGVEGRLAQHPGEHVEAAPHLLAVPRAIGRGELLEVDLFAHGRTLGLRCGRTAVSSHRPGATSRARPPVERRSCHAAAARPARAPRRRAGQAVAGLDLARTGRPRTRRARRRRPARPTRPSSAGGRRPPARRGCGARGRSTRTPPAARARSRVDRRPGGVAHPQVAHRRPAAGPLGVGQVRPAGRVGRLGRCVDGRRRAPRPRRPRPARRPAPAAAAARRLHPRDRLASGPSVAASAAREPWVTRPSRTAWARNGWARDVVGRRRARAARASRPRAGYHRSLARRAAPRPRRCRRRSNAARRARHSRRAATAVVAVDAAARPGRPGGWAPGATQRARRRSATSPAPVGRAGRRGRGRGGRRRRSASRPSRSGQKPSTTARSGQEVLGRAGGQGGGRRGAEGVGAVCEVMATDCVRAARTGGAESPRCLWTTRRAGRGCGATWRGHSGG